MNYYLRENDDRMEDVGYAQFIALIRDEEMDIGSRDDALYRVLTESLRPRLLRRFRPYEKRAPFAFEDALQEFFLSLRGDGSNAYLIFRGLRDASAADAWLLAAFRNFMSKKSRYGVQVWPPVYERLVERLPVIPSNLRGKWLLLMIYCSICIRLGATKAKMPQFCFNMMNPLPV